MRQRPSRLSVFAGVLAIFFLVPGASRAGEEAKMEFEWKVAATYPKFGDEKIDAQVVTWLQKYIADSVDEVKDGVLPEMAGSWKMDTSHEVTRPSDRVVSIVFTSYMYPFMAAHPMSYRAALNLSIADGRQLQLNDLFEHPDKALAIFAEHAPGLLTDLLKEEQAGRLTGDIGPDFFFKEGLAPTAENYDCLGLEPEGVRVHYQVYQILPYVFGSLAPLFPIELLEPAGPNREIWPKR